MENIAIVGNAPHTLISFRLDLIKDLVKRGHNVYAFSPTYNPKQYKIVEEAGAIPVEYEVSRTGLNPIREISVIYTLKNLFEEHNIDSTFCYFIKPVIYGSIAARLAKVRNVNSMIAGLGYAFANEPEKQFEIKRYFVRQVLLFLFKFSLRFNDRIFFQNPDDLKLFVDQNLINEEKAIKVNGSGVHVHKYSFSEPNSTPVTFISTGRLIVEKGFQDFVDAATIVKKKHENVHFVVLGGTDDNPNSLNPDFLRKKVSEGIIQWPGKVDNVGEWLKESSVFVLASYYREGTPRSTLEALATGRAVITTDTPGCRETVEEEINGFLVPPKNPEVLARKMIHLIENPSLIKKMGKESRLLAEKYYDVRKVNQSIITSMGV